MHNLEAMVVVAGVTVHRRCRGCMRGRRSRRHGQRALGARRLRRLRGLARRRLHRRRRTASAMARLAALLLRPWSEISRGSACKSLHKDILFKVGELRPCQDAFGGQVALTRRRCSNSAGVLAMPVALRPSASCLLRPFAHSRFRVTSVLLASASPNLLVQMSSRNIACHCWANDVARRTARHVSIALLKYKGMQEIDVAWGSRLAKLFAQGKSSPKACLSLCRASSARSRVTVAQMELKPVSTKSADCADGRFGGPRMLAGEQRCLGQHARLCARLAERVRGSGREDHDEVGHCGDD